MIPTEDSPQILLLRDADEVRAALMRTRVSAEGIERMCGKALFRLFKVSGLDVRAANILKQEMLSRGGEVAVSREVYEMRAEKADCVVMGTLTQFERLVPKLRLQPFGLCHLADSMETALRNYDNPLPAAPAGLDFARGPLLMGILNVTPDSFSDSGTYGGTAAAVRCALAMAGEGADLIDVGGESTRPGAAAVSVEEELGRVLPVITALASQLPGRISVDTYKAKVAAQALAAGAYMINDISALRMDAEMVAVLRDARCPVVLMHMQGEPRTMQEAPSYDDVVEEVHRFFCERLEWAVDHGLREDDLLLDPGIGFGKTVEHNLQLLRNLRSFRTLGRPLVVGTSRKRFLGSILGIEKPRERDNATAATTALAVWQGAHIVRVHEVAHNREAARVAHALVMGRPAT
jgi:dihydropteroate synthase